MIIWDSMGFEIGKRSGYLCGIRMGFGTSYDLKRIEIGFNEIMGMS